MRVGYILLTALFCWRNVPTPALAAPATPATPAHARDGGAQRHRVDSWFELGLEQGPRRCSQPLPPTTKETIGKRSPGWGVKDKTLRRRSAEELFRAPPKEKLPSRLRKLAEYEIQHWFSWSIRECVCRAEWKIGLPFDQMDAEIRQKLEPPLIEQCRREVRDQWAREAEEEVEQGGGWDLSEFSTGTVSPSFSSSSSAVVTRQQQEQQQQHSEQEGGAGVVPKRPSLVTSSSSHGSGRKSGLASQGGPWKASTSPADGGGGNGGVAAAALGAGVGGLVGGVMGWAKEAVRAAPGVARGFGWATGGWAGN